MRFLLFLRVYFKNINKKPKTWLKLYLKLFIFLLIYCLWLYLLKYFLEQVINTFVWYQNVSKLIYEFVLNIIFVVKKIYMFVFMVLLFLMSVRSYSMFYKCAYLLCALSKCAFNHSIRAWPTSMSYQCLIITFFDVWLL